MRPYERLPEEVEYGGKTYRLNLSYAAFFAAAGCLADDRLTERIKLETTLDILVEDPHPLDTGLLYAVIELTRDDEQRMPTGPRVMDIEQDWPYICAAFQQAYGIDLYSDKSIHIRRFLALLRGLPRDTKLADIISIRSAAIPAPNKHNQDRIAELTRLKAAYALRGSETSMQAGWEKLFGLLQARAQNG